MNLLAEIRTRTEPLHRQLEEVLDIPTQVKSVEQYVALLAQFHALYRPWEKSLLAFKPAFLALGIDIEARLRVGNLERDLRSLAWVVPPESGREGEAVRVDSFPQALGQLYVLEGSTLGGQVLVRLFQSSLGLQGSSLSFFNSHGPQVGKMWKEFCAGLQQFEKGASVKDREEAVRGAITGFETITAYFKNYARLA